jgi:predicted  nucleic acid-binding Zn-ribbon protein
MSRLEQAMARFATSLDLLETHISLFEPKALPPEKREQRADIVTLHLELKQLREDRSKMAHEIERLRTESRQLETITGHVAGRLDGAIRQIRSVIDTQLRGSA